MNLYPFLIISIWIPIVIIIGLPILFLITASGLWYLFEKKFYSHSVLSFSQVLKNSMIAYIFYTGICLLTGMFTFSFGEPIYSLPLICLVVGYNIYKARKKFSH